MNKRIAFTFNGETFTCEEGQSIAAALIAANTFTLRKSRFDDQPRSIFCGIGICFDCVVVIDGISNQRSCLVQVRDGMKVESSI